MSDVSNSEKKSKKIFLFLGISREKHNWDHPIKVLQAAFPSYEVIAFDNKGMGESHQDNAPLSINGNIDFLKKKFDQLKGEENYFIGWSLGGMIATKWSQRYPEDVKKVILITSSFGSLSGFWFRLRSINLPKLIVTIFSKGRKREIGLYDLTNNSAENREKLIQEAQDIQEKRPVSGINIIRQVVAAFFFIDFSLKKKHPTLVLGAPKDKLVNNRCSLRISEFWKTPYEEHPTAGHDILNDDPEWVVKHVKTFIEKAD